MNVALVRFVRDHADAFAELFAAAWDEGVSDADDAWKAAARLSLSGRDQIENPYRAAQHRSKP